MFAIAVFGKEPDISGKILFFQPEKDMQTLINIELNGVKPGKHGLHIHQWGDKSNGCQSMGAHFDTGNNHHGSLKSKIRHTGDLGNVVADSTGKIEDYFLAPVQLCGENTIVGRGIVLHENEDDLGQGGNEESLKTGNAGMRIACAPIVFCSSAST